jgi:ankyrin repeat protein
MTLLDNFCEHVRRGDLPAIKRVLADNRGVLRGAVAGGATPLHLAAEGGNLLVVRTLLQHGADYAVANAAGEVPLMIAAREVRRAAWGPCSSALRAVAEYFCLPLPTNGASFGA